MNTIPNKNIRIQETKGGENLMAKKAIIYCRVATENKIQATSLESQRQRCIRFAQSKGYIVVDTVCEQGSGLRINKQLQKAIEVIKTGKVNTLITSSIDRLGRDFINVAVVIKEIEEHNGEIRCLNEPDSSSEANLLRSIYLGMNKYYLNVMSEHVKRGLEARKQRLATAQPK
jgi:DNA invertase Pin-like site-specific DNA recombinase